LDSSAENGKRAQKTCWRAYIEYWIEW
jgi:hypothetical protein